MDYSNRSNIPNQNSVIAGRRINIPFRCDCLNNEFLGHVFPYQVNTSDTYSLVASNYSDLTTVDMLRRFNRYPDNNIPNDVNVSVVVNCSCGDSAVSEDYGLFVTYPLRQEDNLTYVASTSNVSEGVIRRYNPGLDAKFSAGRGIIYIPGRVNSQCNKGCDLALASFYVWRGLNLTFISQMFSTTIPEIVSYSNKDNIPNQDSVIAGTRINIPFRCDCLDEVKVLGHKFPYKVKLGDTYGLIASNYSDLTNAEWLMKFNRYPETGIPNDVSLDVVVNCSCGDRAVSEYYGLFITYPVRAEDNLTSVALAANVSEDVIRRYNPGVDSKLDIGNGIIYIPGRGTSVSSLLITFSRPHLWDYTGYVVVAVV
ncbi:hypothetical protein T459_19838 [Capsicum annuum]|uniref:LysM domain-containing protein n=1 Tax=Capsicum annuum TaxID=4072 RepID=A0A2G2Z2T9_CAPAN|nr:hypothetical protein T459_19838 [Capsicum annuum]